MYSRNSVPEGEGYTYDYFFLDYVCRLCWSADGIIELTSFSSKSIKNDTTVAAKIQECVGIDVTTYSHPKKICLKCMNEIEIFIEFKRFCQETDKKLHGIIEKGSKTVEIERKRKLGKLTVKPELEGDFSNLGDSIEFFLEDLPLSCQKTLNRPILKKRKLLKNYCNFCHLNVESSEELLKHKFEYHGEENGQFKCFGCEKKFSNVKKRLRHESETCKELKCGYKCHICGRLLPKRRVYEHHVRAHREHPEIELPDDIYKCNKCLKSFESTECLREHMLSHYQKEKKTYVCDTCGRVFTRRDYLYKHKLVHEGGKHQKCPHCNYRTVQRSSLTVHIRKHTGERPYPCDLCPHRCVTSSNLREHRKRHFGIKAFECKLCDKKFGYKISLEEHMSSVHAQSETHTCVQCGATYSRFRGLRRHLLAKHGKKVKKIKDALIEVQNHEEKNINSESEVQYKETDIQNSQMEVQSSQIGIENGQMEVQNSQIEIQVSQVQNAKDVMEVRNVQDAVFITSPIVI